jgi:putative endopeptidase
MTAQTVNAQYSATNNEITFPAGILQRPFFDAFADDAVNVAARWLQTRGRAVLLSEH